VAGAAARWELIRRSDSGAAVGECGVIVPAKCWTYWASNGASEALSVCMKQFPFPIRRRARDVSPTR
jgi:hypothetical protein